MAFTLSTLFCSPQDIWDLLSSEGVDLSLDDHNLSTGQIINATGASAGATSLPVTAIPVALLAGAVLTFDGGTMLAPVAVTLTAPAAVGATSLTVQPLSEAITTGAQARDSGLNAATGYRLTVAARKGTSKVKLYCNARYEDSELVLAGSVRDWAAAIAAKTLTSRRGNKAPKSIKEMYDEAMEELRMVQAGILSIEDIGTRNVDWPTVVNVTVNPSYDGMRARVQANISEQTPTGYGQFIDWNSSRLLYG